jgi:cell division protein FtsL
MRAVLLLLGAILLISSLALITLRQKNRLIHAEIARGEEEISHLEIEYRQLLLEEATFSNLSRIDKIAREKLHMRQPKPEEIEYLP